MKKLTIYEKVALIGGVILICFTVVNLYLGRTQIEKDGWLHLGIGLMAVIYGGRKLLAKKK